MEDTNGLAKELTRVQRLTLEAELMHDGCSLASALNPLDAKTREKLIEEVLKQNKADCEQFPKGRISTLSASHKANGDVTIFFSSGSGGGDLHELYRSHQYEHGERVVCREPEEASPINHNEAYSVITLQKDK